MFENHSVRQRKVIASSTTSSTSKQSRNSNRIPSGNRQTGWTFPLLLICGILSLSLFCPTTYAFDDPAPAKKPTDAKPKDDKKVEPAAGEKKAAPPAKPAPAAAAAPVAAAVEVRVQVRAAAAAPAAGDVEDTGDEIKAKPVVPETPALPSGPMLQLANGGFVAGEIKDSDLPKTLRWQSPGFAVPFDFALNTLSSISVPLPATPAIPTGEYCFELAGGDVLFGSLLGLTDESADINVSRFGRLTVARNQIRRLFRWNNSADLIYMGPNGLGGWESASKSMDFREESGHLVTDKDGAAIRSKFELPPQATIEFELSWTKKPDFEFAFGIDADVKSIPRAYRFEVWDSDLVIQRETAAEADLASLQEIKPGAGRINLQMFLDQAQGRAVVFSSSGKQLATLHVPDATSKPLTGIRLLNKHGDIRLERLRVGRWNGEIPREVEADKSRIHRPDGSIAYGQVQEFDAKAKEFVLKGETGEARVAAADVQSVVLSQGDETQPRSLRAVFQDGVRISGELTKVEGGHVWLTSPGIKEPLHSPWSELQSVVMLAPDLSAVDKTGRIGRLEMPGTKLQGRLAPSPEPLTASCLAWHPIGSANASPLLPETSCRVIFKDPPPVVKLSAQEQMQRQAQRQMAVQQVPVQRNFLLAPFMGNGGAPGIQPRAPIASGGKRYLHLRTGDTIPCEITRIDEKGITFKTTMSDATFVAHEKVKAVELAAEARSINVNKVKRERLLTLPRMQRDNPPTHLIRSINGDYLRGRLTDMDEKKLTMEVRLENREVDRDKIAKIIWLHADELDPTKKQAIEPLQGISRVQVLRSDGIRLTFLAEKLADEIVTGKSDVLGACRADLKQVDQLLVGNSIEVAAAELAYQKWKLQHAVEPLAARDEDDTEDGRTPGIESSLVGKPAPEFELELYGAEGKKLKLSSLKGKVVVLDFFASWCGPCMQSMPQIDQVVSEFKDRDVQLIAVNLEETPARVKATLDRLKLNMTVVMDKEGYVSTLYGATSIPQTVVIDPAGNVTRVFVGSSPQLAGNLKDAISSQFMPAATGEEKKPDEAKPDTKPPEAKPDAPKDATKKEPLENET